MYHKLMIFKAYLIQVLFLKTVGKWVGDEIMEEENFPTGIKNFLMGEGNFPTGEENFPTVEEIFQHAPSNR